MKIYGYSERGIVNSIIFNIGDKKKLITEFVKLIPVLSEIDEPDDYDILLEQSFSKFGTSDLIIIAHYYNPIKNLILFYEAKVKANNKSWTLDKQFNNFNYQLANREERDKYNVSNLFYQLYLKELLISNIEGLDNNKTIDDILNIPRKIGNNEIVKKAVKILIDVRPDCCYYIGIIPSTEEQSKQLDFNKQIIHFLPWNKIEDFAEANKLDKVLETFQFNKGQIY